MDEAFEEWVQNDSQKPCVKQWADQLIQLGTSWDSFRQGRKEDAIVQDLTTAGGIPLLAARDIVQLAQQEIQRAAAPMAIFWDLENMPIPNNTSGRDVTTRLKTILSPYGNLVQFRAYASIGLGHIPRQKRSDLQLSGCHLVDCPHNGRKEVADKMIIVDAMQFAYTNAQGATLCFITGDVDYAYLLAVLQKPQWRTIVISKGTISSMLHVNCEVRMRWESDILLLRPSSSTNNNEQQQQQQSKQTSAQVINAKSRQENETVDGTHEKITGRVNEASQMAQAENGPDMAQEPPQQYERLLDDSISTTVEPDAAINNNKSGSRFEALTPMEEWTDDVELLRSILKANGGVAFKRTIGSLLHKTNPARFSNRMTVRNFIANAIDARVVIETGEGSYKEISLPSGTPFPVIRLSKILPRYLRENLPEKTFTVSEKMPYILFIPRRYITSRDVFSPKKTYVQRSLDGLWMILMFGSLVHLQQNAQELPPLKGCTLVDWRTVNLNDEDALVGECCRCGTDLLESQVIYKLRQNEEDDPYCWKCYPWDNATERKRGVMRVIAMLTMMTENDDIYITRKLLKKLLYQRYPGVCTTHKHAELWIDEAVNQDKVAPFKKEGQTSIKVCLTSNVALANGEHPPDDLDTEEEERYVESLLLQEPDDFVPRKAVIHALRRKFPAMENPLWCAKAFHNGQLNKRFYVARGPYGQTVGLTDQEAREALERMTKLIREELTWNFDCDSQSMLKPEMEIPESSDEAALLENASDEVQETGTAVTDDDEEPRDAVVAFVNSGQTKLQTDLKVGAPEPEAIVEADGTSRSNREEVPPVLEGRQHEQDFNTEDWKETLDLAPVDPATTYLDQADEISDWDGESVDSAVIDARLLNRIKSVEGSTAALAS